MPHEHGGDCARVRYSGLEESRRFAVDAGVMQIQLRKSRFWLASGETQKSTAPNQRERSVADS